MAENLEQQINQEVQRRLGSQMRRSHEEVAELRDIIRDQNTKLVQQHSTLKRLLGEPLMFGTLLKVHNSIDPRCFKTHDTIIVCDQSSAYYQQGGAIISGLNDTPVIDEDGFCVVKLHNESEVRFSVGAEGKAPAQVRLSEKDDGTFAVVSIDGKPWEVKGIPDLSLTVGDPVKIKPDTKAIVSRGYNLTAGPVCHVVSVTDKGVEVQAKSDRVIVFNPHNFTLEEGDRVACDHGMFCIIEKLERDPRERYKLKNDLTVTWNDVGGLDIAKAELRDALELPFTQPDLFQHYGVQPLRGILLYGAPEQQQRRLLLFMARNLSRLDTSMSNLQRFLTSGLAIQKLKFVNCLNVVVGTTENMDTRAFWLLMKQMPLCLNVAHVAAVTCQIRLCRCFLERWMVSMNNRQKRTRLSS